VRDAFINGRSFPVEEILTGNRTASARLKEGRIVIRLPGRWPREEREKTAASLLKRVIKAISEGKWDISENRRISFRHGQRMTILGREYRVEFVPGNRLGVSHADGRIVVADPMHPEKSGKADALIKKRIIKEALPRVKERVAELNRIHFGARIGELRMRENRTRWGSCSPDGSISLDLRLLFLPEQMLDYVIVHELAHTRYKSHGPRFWSLVQGAMPDHKERRRWLREESARHIRETLEKVEPQRTISDFLPPTPR